MRQKQTRRLWIEDILINRKIRSEVTLSVEQTNEKKNCIKIEVYVIWPLHCALCSKFNLKKNESHSMGMQSPVTLHY